MTSPSAAASRPVPGWFALHVSLRDIEGPRSPLVQFVVLSIAVHMLLIALFGAPSGGSREGRAMWGSLRVLIGPPPISLPEPTLKLDRGTVTESPGPARAKESAVERDSTYQPPRLPPAPTPTPAPLKLSPAKTITPSAVPEVAPEGPPLEPAPAPAPIRVEPLPVQPLFVPMQKPEPTVIPELKAPVIPPTVPAPPKSEEPALPAPPAPEPPAPAPPVPEIPPPPRIEVPTVEAPPLPAPILQPLTPVAPEPTPARPAERAPVEAPPVPVRPLEPVVPPKSEPATSAAPSEPRAAPASPPVERVEQRLPDRAPAPAAEPATRAPATRPSSPPFDMMNVPRATPREAPAPDAGKPGTIDLDAARRRARELAREGTGNRAPFALPMPAPAPKKSKEELALEKAAKPDCQTAYKDLGLLAVIPLVANEFGEGSCRWR